MSAFARAMLAKSALLTKSEKLRGKESGPEFALCCNKMRYFTAAALTSMLLTCAVPSAAFELCMSDSELRGYLAQSFGFNLGRTAAVCWQYPSFRSEAPKWIKALSASQDAHSKRSYNLAIQPFKRSFGDTAKAMLDKYLEAATPLPTLTEAECQRILWAYEGLSFSTDDMSEVWVNSIFAAERKRTPTCK